MTDAKKMFLESIKLDLKHLEGDSMNLYSPSKLREIIGNEAFEDYAKRLAEMKDSMPRFLDPNELDGEARYIWIRIKECYKNREKYQRRKKERKKTKKLNALLVTKKKKQVNFTRLLRMMIDDHFSEMKTFA